MDSARALTGSRYGALSVLRDAGGSGGQTVVSGLSPEECEALFGMPEDGPAFFERFDGLREPLRVSDIAAYLSAMDFPGFLVLVPATSLLVAPIRHQGARVGTIFLAHDRHNEEYAEEDEEAVVTFASQAAMAIANARRHREEQRARADLETLTETSPVGVVVFDATGALRSLNREARRIVDSLRDPDQTPEDLLDVVAFRRADGREISLREFGLAALLGIGETVRSEEIVIAVPDGRSVRVLLNATPIRSDEEAVESVVVTLQDMADVEELERLRAEFLAMVSHELRVPLTSIKGSASTALDPAVDPDPAVVRQFFRIIEDQADHMSGLVSDLLDVARLETGTLPVSPEPAEVAVLVDRARTAFTNARGENAVQIDIEPDLPLVVADRRRIVQVLTNLLTNASRNAPESSLIGVSAVREDVHVAISVTDRGPGILAESLPRLFSKFSGAHSEEPGGDAGLGLAICKGIVEAHGGRIWAESDGPGLGACFTFTLPTVEPGGSARAVVESPSGAEESLRAGQEARVPVLAVDDDPEALRFVRDTLVAQGYKPVVTGDPEEVLRLVDEHKPALALLDLVLPGADGIDLMGEILHRADMPVIFLSAYGRDELIARAFEMGATDYVVKPFSPTELAARIKATLRRREVSEPPQPYVLGDLAIDYAERRVTIAGEQIRLTPTEYRMLAELSANAGTLLTYERLLTQVWNEGPDGDVRPMRTIVGKLRRKLGEDAVQPKYIFTEPRVGYRMPRGGRRVRRGNRQGERQRP